MTASSTESHTEFSRTVQNPTTNEAKKIIEPVKKQHKNKYLPSVQSPPTVKSSISLKTHEEEVPVKEIKRQKKIQKKTEKRTESRKTPENAKNSVPTEKKTSSSPSVKRIHEKRGSPAKSTESSRNAAARSLERVRLLREKERELEIQKKEFENLERKKQQILEKKRKLEEQERSIRSAERQSQSSQNSEVPEKANDSFQESQLKTGGLPPIAEDPIDEAPTFKPKPRKKKSVPPVIPTTPPKPEDPQNTSQSAQDSSWRKPPIPHFKASSKRTPNRKPPTTEVTDPPTPPSPQVRKPPLPSAAVGHKRTSSGKRTEPTDPAEHDEKTSDKKKPKTEQAEDGAPVHERLYRSIPELQVPSFKQLLRERSASPAS